MTGPVFELVPLGGHELHVARWGDRGKPALTMVHGLARTGRDFDDLAAALAKDYCILCPDLVGRGLSSWSSRPETDYSLAAYAQLMLDLLDHYGIDRTGWIGTSLGGLIGMWLAAGPDAHRLDALVINDIGPQIPQAAIDRIVTYVGAPPRFATVTEAEAWLRETYLPFGPAPDSFWRRMAQTSVRRLPEGDLTLHYDPAITTQFTASAQELTTWDRWQRIETPTHLLRGAHSDLLLADTARRMQQTGPKPALTTYEDCGHAPSLATPAAIADLRAILQQLSPQN